MLLQRLREYSERLDLPPSLYADKPVRYLVDLDTEGRFVTFSDLADPSSPKTKRGRSLKVPFIVRTSKTQPLLCADTAEYTFGLAEPGKEGRAQRRHDAYLELVSECAAVTGNADIRAVERFLLGDPLSIELPADLDPGGLITFRVGESFPQDAGEIRQYWARRFEPDVDPGAGDLQQCFVCGEQRPLREQVPDLIQGIPGGQMRKALVFGGGDGPFTSYGITSRACANCEEVFSRSLNNLLADERSRIRFSDSVYVFWTRDDQAQGWVPLLEEADPAEVKLLLESVKTGKRTVGPEPERFFALALSAAGGRAVVREWIDTTLPEAEKALARWFRRQGIVDGFSEETRYFGIKSLAGATVRDWRDISAPTTRTLLRAALTGSPLPMDMLAAAVRRTQADQGVNAPQAALIKLVLTSHASPEGRESEDGEEHHMADLQADHPSVGYQCGRLMAVLESIQRSALPGVKAGIVARYFGSASSTPLAAFPRLVRGAQPHLTRLRRDKPGAYVALQQRLEEVSVHIPPVFPTVLSLPEQGSFALGYYHQRAHDRARAMAAKKRVAAGQATDQDRHDADVDEEGDDD